MNEIPDLREVVGTLACNVCSFPAKYLGLPLGEKVNTSAVWDGISESVKESCLCWKRKYLSLGGKLMLINSVLDSLPAYTMSLFSVLVSVLKRLDKLFFWIRYIILLITSTKKVHKK